MCHGAGLGIQLVLGSIASCPGYFGEGKALPSPARLGMRLLAACNLLCNQEYHTLLWLDTIRPQSGYVWGKEWRIKGTVCKGGVSGDRLSERWLGRPKEHFLANITPTSSDIRAISDIAFDKPQSSRYQ